MLHPRRKYVITPASRGRNWRLVLPTARLKPLRAALWRNLYIVLPIPRAPPSPPPCILREKIVTLFPSAAGQCWIDKYARSLRRLCVVLGAGEEDRGRGGGALSSRFCLWTIRSLENVSHVSYGGESGRGSEVFAGEKI